MKDYHIISSMHRRRFVFNAALCLAFFSLGFAIAGSFLLLEQYFIYTLAAHLLAAITGGKAGAISDRRRLGTHFFPWIMAFTIPLYGGTIAYFLLEMMKKHKTGTLLEDYSEYLNDAASYSDSVPILEREIPESSELVSLADMLSGHSSEAERRIAAEYLADMETQSAVNILRKVASSSKKESYFFAMTAMSRLEEKMLTRLQEHEDAIKLAGLEKTEVELILKTAMAYFDFIYYQFAIGDRRAEYLKKCENLLALVINRSAENSSERNDALILLGRVKLQTNDVPEAIKYFNRYIELNPESATGYLWRMEGWFMLAQYEHLREDCRKVKALGRFPQNMAGIIDFWISETASA